MIMGMEMCHMQRARVKGRKFFHSKCMSWSYRNRGYEARIHKNRAVRESVFSMKFIVNISGCRGLGIVLMKMIVVRAFIRMMFMYSAMKNKANGPAAYSTLKPETSSDSPSVKSNGARLVSAKVEMNHIVARGHVGSSSQMFFWVYDRVDRLNDPLSNRIDRRMMASVTSYEIVWATARSAPNNAYLEFDAHPDQRIEYTARLDVARMNSAPRFILIKGCGIGMGIHSESASVRASVGAMVNKTIDDVEGCTGSLMNSFRASAIGWRIPYGPTMFGPLRSCI